MAEGGGEDEGEKKHDPSERKLRKAAERGQMARSQDLTAVAVIVAASAAMVFLGPTMMSPLVSLSHDMYAHASAPLDYGSTIELGRRVLMSLVLILMVPLAAAVFASLVANLAQTQLQLATEFEIKWERIDPTKGFKRVYMSWQPLMELAKGFLKLGALGAVVFYSLYERIDALPTLATMPPSNLLREMAEIAWLAIVRAMPVLIVIAAVDYAYAWWRHWEDNKRTDKEVKDEHKEQEGDPWLQAARRRRAREIAQGKALAQIKDADVLVVNPTHYAVALRYRREQDNAPVVLAKGVDHLALKMRREALRLGVPRVEDRALARTLYIRGKVGREIPEDLYGPVAKVLAVVFRRRAAARSG